MRHADLAHFKLIPLAPYYDTADVAPLYLIVLGPDILQRSRSRV
jgi:hypothetical protein